MTESELFTSTEDYLSNVAFNTFSIKFFERFDGESRIWNFQRHEHNFFEFIYFIDGHARIKAGSEDFEVSLFDLIIYPPRVSHEEHLTKGYRQEIYCFWIDLGPSPPFEQGILVKDTNGELRVLLDALYKEYIGRRSLKNELLAVYFRALFLLIRRYFIEGPQNNDNVVERCLNFIHEHYAQDFSIEEMSHAIYVSPSYLFRSFKKKIGVTPMHYRNLIRIEKAKLLLCASNQCLDLIAQEVGFTDVKYFSHLFKKTTGFTPGTFRKRNLKALS
jgi:AraC-like DNA-binding protein/mannose-6-phosphate isomerase-like protein (cupin superfamily)